mmetsp:Transcript_95239/g.293741  ORF Transcript_95239/g.293741 Transcript_95239/m.293741 type:complete len:226 (-) Transcript_95239:29-706(-)
MRAFHDRHADVGCVVEVTRHPYSFLGDDRRARESSGLRDGTWHEGLINYAGGTEEAALRFEEGLSELGQKVGIAFDFDVFTQWQPVDSQRLLKWCGRWGKQEEFMEELNKGHFQQRRSASERASLLAAVDKVGLDRAEAEAFLDTDEGVDAVWKSYGDTIKRHHIHAIPYLVFNLAGVTNGGPFRSAGNRAGEVTINGSASPEEFLDVLDHFQDLSQRKRSSAAL